MDSIPVADTPGRLIVCLWDSTFGLIWSDSPHAQPEWIGAKPWYFMAEGDDDITQARLIWAGVMETGIEARSFHSNEGRTWIYLLRRVDADCGVAMASVARQVPGFDGLSRRELGVLTLAARGMAMGEIAAALGIATSTVKTHCQRMRAKLHLNSQSELIAFASKAEL